MLVYPNGRIQHAGAILGAVGIAAHTDKARPKSIRGYHDRTLVDQDVSCVTGACMLVRRGGLSCQRWRLRQEALAIAFKLTSTSAYGCARLAGESVECRALPPRVSVGWSALLR